MAMILKRVLCPELPAPGGKVELPDSEGNHVARVLRMRTGDRIEAIDGKGGSTVVRIRIEGKKVWIERPTEQEFSPQNASEEAKGKAPLTVLPIVLNVAILKGEAMEWMVEKAVELGVREFVPLIAENSVVKLDNKGPAVFQERWQKIAQQALKQCGRLDSMKVHAPIRSTEWIKQFSSQQNATDTLMLWCDEAARKSAPHLLEELSKSSKTSPKGVTIQIIIGPEGGWTNAEAVMLRSAARSVSLGPLVLRAETAALTAVGTTASWYRWTLADRSS